MQFGLGPPRLGLGHQPLGLGEMAQPHVPLLRSTLGLGEQGEKERHFRHRSGGAVCGHAGSKQFLPR
jgi:hypothetical protein